MFRRRLQSPLVTFRSGAVTVQFTSIAFDPDGHIASYNWDFGDGSASTQLLPLHTYQQAGTLSAKLTVTDNGGASASATATITVTWSQPAVSAVAPNVGSPNGGSPVVITGTGFQPGAVVNFGGVVISNSVWSTAQPLTLSRGARRWCREHNGHQQR